MGSGFWLGAVDREAGGYEGGENGEQTQDTSSTFPSERTRFTLTKGQVIGRALCMT
jgi:hypothetical protein